jgi:hypothetical protein
LVEGIQNALQKNSASVVIQRQCFALKESAEKQLESYDKYSIKSKDGSMHKNIDPNWDRDQEENEEFLGG